jgi:hypothetical protein
VYAGGAGFQHVQHQLVGVEHAAETSLGVGHDRHQPIDVVVALGVVDLVGAAQGVVDATHHVGYRVGGVQRLVRIHRAGGIGVRRHLPTRQVDGLQASLHLLHRLVAGQRAQRVDEGLRVQRAPQALGAAARQRMLYVHGAPQAHHVGRGVRTHDVLPAQVVLPVELQLFGGGKRNFHDGFLGWAGG